MAPVSSHYDDDDDDDDEDDKHGKWRQEKEWKNYVNITLVTWRWQQC